MADAGSPLLTRLEADLLAARKAQDRAAVLLLGTVVSEVRNRALAQDAPLADDDVVDVVRKAIKKRRESQALYAENGRDEQAAVEGAEADALAVYLPAQVSEDELRRAVRDAIAAGATNVGAVMGRVMPRFKGRADGRLLNEIVRAELAAAG